MAMTKREYIGKEQIIRRLQQDGYPTYARLIKDFEIHLTKDPEVIGYMIPSKGVICVNENLDIKQVGVVVRHEILHEFFNHAKRFSDHIGVDNYAHQSPAMHKLMNYAGDYDISNRGYTEEDKKSIQRIIINGKILQGLVTEVDHPDWVNLSATEIYDRLMDEYKKEREQMKKDLAHQQKEEEQEMEEHDQDYIDTYNKIIKKYGNMSEEEIEDVLQRFHNGENVL